MNKNTTLISIIVIIVILALGLFALGQTSSTQTDDTASSTPQNTDTTDSSPTVKTTTPSPIKKAATVTTPLVSGTHFTNYLYNNSDLSKNTNAHISTMTQLRVAEPVPNAQTTIFTVTPNTVWTKDAKRVSLYDMDATDFPYLSFTVIASQVGTTWTAKEVDLKTISFTVQKSAYYSVTKRDMGPDGVIKATSPVTNNFSLSNGMNQSIHIASPLYSLFAGEESIAFTANTKFLLNGVTSTYDAVNTALSNSTGRALLKAAGYVTKSDIIATEANFVI